MFLYVNLTDRTVKCMVQYAKVKNNLESIYVTLTQYLSKAPPIKKETNGTILDSVCKRVNLKTNKTPSYNISNTFSLYAKLCKF